MTEAEAYLRQASSDFQVFEHLAAADRERAPECHPLHYLQMACEKMAKAIFLATGQSGFDQFGHVAFSILPYHLRRLDVARALGWKDFGAYLSFLRRAAPLFRQVDELHPAVGTPRVGGRAKEGPNVEYPWRARNAAGQWDWRVPSEHSFRLIGKLQASGDGATLLLFIRRVLERFEAIFG